MRRRNSPNHRLLYSRSQTWLIEQLYINSANSSSKSEIVLTYWNFSGLIHEQQRPDRDEYVDILWQNVDPKYKIKGEFASVNADSELNIDNTVK